MDYKWKRSMIYFLDCTVPDTITCALAWNISIQLSKRSEFFQIFFKFSRLLLIFQTISKLSEFFVRSKSALFRLVVRNGFAHSVRKVFACRKLLPGKFWVFAPLELRCPSSWKLFLDDFPFFWFLSSSSRTQVTTVWSLEDYGATNHHYQHLHGHQL